MVILTKKKILYLLGLISIVVLLFLIVIDAINKKNIELNTIQTVSMPVDRKIIILDAGHGKPDERR